MLFTNGLVLNETGVTEGKSSEIIDNRGKTGFGITYKWTGDLVGTLAVLASNDADGAGTIVGWVDISASLDAITTGGGTAEGEVTGKHAFYRINFSFTSGEGDLQIAINTNI